MQPTLIHTDVIPLKTCAGSDKDWKSQLPDIRSFEAGAELERRAKEATEPFLINPFRPRYGATGGVVAVTPNVVFLYRDNTCHGMRPDYVWVPINSDVVMTYDDHVVREMLINGKWFPVPPFAFGAKWELEQRGERLYARHLIPIFGDHICYDVEKYLFRHPLVSRNGGQVGHGGDGAGSPALNFRPIISAPPATERRP